MAARRELALPEADELRTQHAPLLRGSAAKRLHELARPATRSSSTRNIRSLSWSHAQAALQVTAICHLGDVRSPPASSPAFVAAVALGVSAECVMRAAALALGSAHGHVRAKQRAVPSVLENCQLVTRDLREATSCAASARQPAHFKIVRWRLQQCLRQNIHQNIGTRVAETVRHLIANKDDLLQRYLTLIAEVPTARPPPEPQPRA